MFGKEDATKSLKIIELDKNEIINILRELFNLRVLNGNCFQMSLSSSLTLTKLEIGYKKDSAEFKSLDHMPSFEPRLHQKSEKQYTFICIICLFFNEFFG